MKLITTFLVMLVFISCETRDKSKLPNTTKDTNLLIDYQQYALKRILQADFDEQGFHQSDSFYLWSWDDLGKEFKKNRITRTYSDGSYHYTFWTRLGDTAMIYAEDSISRVQLIKDTLFDANGDETKDLVVTYNPNNGKCPPDLTILFILDSAVNQFRKMEAIEDIPYAKFHPKDKTITSEMTCGSYKESYKFKWNKNFRVDTIYSKVTKL